MAKEKPTGTKFEDHVQLVCEAYAAQGRASLAKVAPPVLVLRGGAKVIPLPNPFVDFTGAWTERGGRALHIEAKSTTDPRLPIYNETGIKPHQIENLERWRKAGAAVGVLWEYGTEVRMVSLSLIYKTAEVRKSIPWVDAYPIPKGTGLVSFDFLATLGQMYPKPAA